MQAHRHFLDLLLAENTIKAAKKQPRVLAEI